MKILLIVGFIVFESFAIVFPNMQRCPSVSDGRYVMQYTFNSHEKPSILEILDGRYRKYQNDKIIDSGNITILSDCIYAFKSKVYSVDTAGLSGLLNRSFGSPCTEVTRVNIDTIFFRMTYCGNLHITQNEGQLIKIKYGR